MQNYGNIIETTPDKLDTIAFSAGQYIIVATGNANSNLIYYDSFITGKRELFTEKITILDESDIQDIINSITI